MKSLIRRRIGNLGKGSCSKSTRDISGYTLKEIAAGKHRKSRYHPSIQDNIK